MSRRQMLGWSSAAIAAGGLATAGISTPANAQSPTPGHAEGDFSGLVDIGGRSLYLTCAGSAGPTVVLVTGYRDTSDIWTIDQRNLTDPRTMVMPSVAAFTRVCAYDRPGTRRFDDTLTPSASVPQPTTVENGADDLHTLLTAAREPGPYVLVGASWGGMITRLYASTWPNEVAGLVFVDGASEFFKETLTPEQWTDWMRLIRSSKSGDNEVPDYESSIAEISSAPLTRQVPSIVLTADKPWDLRVGRSGSTFPAWLASQDLLSAQLGARHITQTNSSHGIAVEQPQVVVAAIHDLVEQIRALEPK